MKRRNMNKTIMQRGGLMIEALAMLGLIAVVTPTMYKKSAERTMEVEDINTASTIRTVMNAANDYVSSNYSTLISEMNKGEGTTVRTIEKDDIEAFLPYGFNLDSALRNYNEPTMKVVRPDKDSNNLTAFVVFPAKADADEGIGQERTSRIAALVGSNGGYKPTADTARGVGGIWSLDAEKFGKVFGSNIGNQYSIVTASTDIINSATNNEVDMTKYLQRGKDTEAGTEWKNTMRTDLYMGGPNADGDIYKDQTGPYSILNIKSLIVGTDTAPEEGNYGLYLAESADNPNAYVHGSLEAGEGHFKADSENLAFGTGADDAWNFLVNTAGNVMNKGNLNLASDNGVWDDIKIGALMNNGSNKYLIQGSKTHPDASGGMSTPYDYGSLTFMDDLMKLTDASNDEDKKVKIMENGWAKDENGNQYGEIKYAKYLSSSDDAGVPIFPVEIGANAEVKGALAAAQIDTNKIRTASLSVGSKYVNDKYHWMTVDEDGVLIADPSGRNTDNTKTKNRININKDQIVLSVDKDAKDVTNPRGKDATDGHETSAHDAQIIMNAKNFLGSEKWSEEKAASIEIKAPNVAIHGDSTTVSGKGTLIQAGSDISDYGVTGNNLDNNRLLLRNDNMQISMTVGETVSTGDDGTVHRTPNDTAETVIGPRNEANKYKIRTVFDKGNVALVDSNLNVLNASNNPVFSVGTNGKLDGFPTPYADIYTVATGENGITSDNRKAALGHTEKYDVAAHGNIIFTSKLVPEVTEDGRISRNSLHRTYLSMGDAINSFAAVNIVGLSVDSSDGNNEFSKVPLENKSNIVLVDQVASSEYNNKNLAEPGTIYIRKGYLEVKGNDITGTKESDPKSGNGVIVASRFVANNPQYNGTGKSYYGAKVTDLISTKDRELYEGKSFDGENPTGVRYDTYMVNPAYTSVMHDIKLTTRGGARLSDVLPDFINKGIYVVTNSYQEKVNELSFLGAGDVSQPAEEISIESITGYDSSSNGTLDKAGVWGSPYLGNVPAPQCPPGYGRVITLTPSSFNMGTAGYLHKSNSAGRGYFVYPDIASEGSIKAQSTFDHAQIVAADKDASITLNSPTSVGLTQEKLDVKSVNNFATAKYVLASDSDQSTKPLTFQQSTWLKTLTVPLYKKIGAEDTYVQAWATIMGFIYPASQYKKFLEEADGVNIRTTAELRLSDGKNYNKQSYYWNIFPVIAKSLEGYATVYCYFDRTNIFGGFIKDDYKNNFIDSQDYMKNMNNIPSNYQKGLNSYTGRLNDPELKYNEVW